MYVAFTWRRGTSVSAFLLAKFLFAVPSNFHLRRDLQTFSRRLLSDKAVSYSKSLSNAAAPCGSVLRRLATLLTLPPACCLLYRRLASQVPMSGSAV